ncbi:MAG: DUF4445 domain-containing protein [Clostridia bacterium]|nr:DUF4445 domain-containing protein [Clostridia bacterium]
MFKVKIENSILPAFQGENLRELLIKNGFYINSPCGGNGTCGKCIVTVNGERVKSCCYSISSDISVVIPEKEEILSSRKVAEIVKYTNDNNDIVLCLDIGTSTLALAMVSKADGKALKVVTKTNAQRVFGADVISRIDYCKKNSVAPLKDALINQINNMLEEIDASKPCSLFVSGNTCMLHFFFGKDASSLGVYPYTPVFLESQTVSGEALGLKNVTNVISLPCISAFVGADLTAGLSFIEKPKDNKYNILVDLGTNAETLLFSKDKLLCTSAAAGPCFEGGNISCGMSASDGAIYSFSIDENGNKKYKTIGNSSPEGICGTGLFDIVAELLKENIIDETGYMSREDFKITENVSFSQKDVRQFQLAKSAVRSALTTLMKLENISFDDIEALYISGGFSQELNINNAIFTGLLPKEAEEKIKTLNNTSLSGTVKFALDGKNPLDEFKIIEYVDLSASPDFSESFINNMDF